MAEAINLSAFAPAQMAMAKAPTPMESILPNARKTFASGVQQHQQQNLDNWMRGGAVNLANAAKEIGLDGDQIYRMAEGDYNGALEYVAKEAEKYKYNQAVSQVGSEVEGWGSAKTALAYDDKGMATNMDEYRASLEAHGTETLAKIQENIRQAQDPITRKAWEDIYEKQSKISRDEYADDRNRRADDKIRMETQELQRGMVDKVAKEARTALETAGLKDIGVVATNEATTEMLSKAAKGIEAFNAKLTSHFDPFGATQELASSAEMPSLVKWMSNIVMGMVNKNHQYSEAASEEAAKKHLEALSAAAKQGDAGARKALADFKIAITTAIMAHIKEMSGAAVSEGEAQRYKALFGQGLGSDVVIRNFKSWQDNRNSEIKKKISNAKNQLEVSKKLSDRDKANALQAWIDYLNTTENGISSIDQNTVDAIMGMVGETTTTEEEDIEVVVNNVPSTVVQGSNVNQVDENPPGYK